MKRPYHISLPLLPNRIDALRRLIGKLDGEYEEEFKHSQRRHNVERLVVTLEETDGRCHTIIYMKADDPEKVLTNLIRSKDDFDKWLVGQFRKLYGADFDSAAARQNETIFDWRISLDPY